jgi:hypothetical protein
MTVLNIDPFLIQKKKKKKRKEKKRKKVRLDKSFGYGVHEKLWLYKVTKA